MKRISHEPDNLALPLSAQAVAEIYSVFPMAYLILRN